MGDNGGPDADYRGPDRITPLEQQVMLLVKLLRSLTAIVGEMNMHVALPAEEREKDRFHRRVEEIGSDVTKLLERFERHWPDLRPEPPESN